MTTKRAPLHPVSVMEQEKIEVFSDHVSLSAVDEVSGFRFDRVRETPTLSAPANRSGHFGDELIAWHRPTGTAAESFRSIRNNIVTILGQPHRTESLGKAIAVVSSDVGDGRSYVAANLAIVYANLATQHNEAVLLIDANLRAPCLHRWFNVENEVGLNQILANGVDIEAAIVRLSEIGGLALLPAGREISSSPDILNGNNLPRLMQGLLQQFALIIIDTSAGSHGDYRPLVAQTRGVLMVARKDRSSLPVAQNLVRDLRATQTQILGCVFNNVEVGFRRRLSALWKAFSSMAARVKQRHRKRAAP